MGTWTIDRTKQEPGLGWMLTEAWASLQVPVPGADIGA